MKRSTRNVLRFGGISLLLLTVAGVALWQLFASDPGADAVPVTIAAARSTTLQTRVVGSCTFRPRRSVTLVSDSGGRVAAIPVAVGDAVTAGQELVLIDDGKLLVAMRQAEAGRRAAEVSVLNNLLTRRSELRTARIALQRARATLQRQRELYAAGGVQQADVRQAEQDEADAADALRAARVRLNLATGRAAEAEPAADGAGDGAVIAADPDVINARLSEAQAALDLAQATVVAPLAGTVTSLAASLGNHLAPGAEVVTVATLDDIVADVQVDEVDVGKIRVGQEVVLTSDSIRDLEFPGAIALIPPTMTDHQVTVEVDVDERRLPAGAQLRAGASCRARIEAELKRDVTAVPFAALQERPGGSVAFVAVPEGDLYRLERREVTLGVSSVNEVEVTTGVEAGEQVVVGNLSLLRADLLVMAEQDAGEDSAPAPEEQDPAP